MIKLAQKVETTGVDERTIELEVEAGNVQMKMDWEPRKERMMAVLVHES